MRLFVVIVNCFKAFNELGCNFTKIVYNHNVLYIKDDIICGSIGDFYRNLLFYFCSYSYLIKVQVYFIFVGRWIFFLTACC